MTNRPKRRWLLRSLLGVIFAMLAWISFPWFYDSRLIWSIRQPLATRNQDHPPAVICYDPYGRWVFLKHTPKQKFDVACTVLEQDNGKIVQENVILNRKDQYVPWTATEINESGELIYMVSKPNYLDNAGDEADKSLGWFIIKAWNLLDGQHSEKMRIPMALKRFLAHSRDGSILISCTFKGATLEIEKWMLQPVQCTKRLVISNVNSQASIIISKDCHWVILGKSDAHYGHYDYGVSASYIANEEKHRRLWPERDLLETQSLRLIDIDGGAETKEIKGFPSPARNIVVRDNLIVLGFQNPPQETTWEYYEIDLSIPDRTLRPINDAIEHHGLITPHSLSHWIEQLGTFSACLLRRVDLIDGHREEHPYFPLPDTEQASPLGESLMIVNHTQPIKVPGWLESWLTKYDLTNYWPWKACKRMVICEAETGKEVWQKRFPADGYLQADMSRDQSKLFVLYWKNDELELYAYSLDFSWRSYWKQSCAALATFLVIAFLPWPRRNAKPARA